MKKKLSLLLAGAMLAMSLAACGDKTSSAAADATTGAASSASTTNTSTGQNLVVQIGPNPETLDPALNTTSDVSTTNLHLFQGLLTYDENEVLVPGQAAALPEVSDDGLVYTFTLRDDLKWSDGTPLTAEDFEYSWKRLADPETAAPYAEMMIMIAGYDEATGGDVEALQVKAVDDTTFEVTLSYPCSYFPSVIAGGIFQPVQKATVEENGLAWATTPETFVSNGAFKMSEYVRSEYILMEKNENYWDADNVTLDSIKFLLIENDSAALSAFQNGTAQMVKSIPGDEIKALKETESFHLDPLQGLYYILYNVENEYLADANVRKALNLAIDRDYIAETTMNGTYIAADSFVPPGIPDVADGSEFREVAKEVNGGPLIDTQPNIEEAKKLMEAAGYSETNTLKLNYSTNKQAFHVPVAEALQQMWKEIYVDLTISEVEWATFTPQRRAGDFEISRGGWICDYPDATTMLDLLYSTNGNNNSRYKSTEYDALLDKAATTLDTEERYDLLHEAEELLIADDAVGPLAYYTEFYLLDPSVKGAYHTSLGSFYFMYATIEE